MDILDDMGESKSSAKVF